jgi:toxin YoeB
VNNAFTPIGWEDYVYWARADRAIFKPLNRLIVDARRSPTDGPGKPEPLKYQGTATWSRRLTLAHRLVYQVRADEILVLTDRFHYD